MKYIIILLIQVLCFAKPKTLFYGQTHSIIDWEKIDAVDWMNFQNWKDERVFRDKYPHWETLKRIERNRELAGRIFACYGTCKLFRGDKDYRVGFKSAIREGDEVSTGKGSLLWIFLIDGTMIRLSPESSITIKEINILKDKNFVFARINEGHIFWLSRNPNNVKVQTRRETDSVFFPFKFYDAIPYTRAENIPLQEYLFGDTSVLDSQYEKLNNLIDENNKWLSKPTVSFITMPLGTISGENLSLEVYSSIGQENIFKLRSEREMGLKKPLPHSAKLNLRGYSNNELLTVREETWYKLTPSVRKYEEIESTRNLNLGEFITKRIPSILVARELLLQKYSKFLGDKWNPQELALKYGYRLWNELELTKRISFLFKNTRNLETSNIIVAQRYRKQILEKYGEKDKSVVRRSFFKLSLAKYIRRGEVEKETFFSPRLNSEKKKLWKKLHGYRPKDEDDSSFGKP